MADKTQGKGGGGRGARSGGPRKGFGSRTGDAPRGRSSSGAKRNDDRPAFSKGARPTASGGARRPDRPTDQARPKRTGGQGGRGEAPRRFDDRSSPSRASHTRTPGRADANRRQATASPPPAAEGQRIAKVMARAGLCSRRDAEAWIAEGRVSLNGVVLQTPAVVVGPRDRVVVDGQELPAAERTRLFLFHKPRGLVTTDRDPDGRATIFDHLRQHAPTLPRVVTVGRLDINTEGLLLLTNDGGLARVLELPSTGWLRRYRVRANGATDQAQLDALAKGLTIDGVDYAGIEATLDRVQGANAWMTIGLREGKNREIKRVLEHLGLAVNRLIRLSFGPFGLADLPEGAVTEVRTRVLRDQLGPSLAAEAECDFDSPTAEERAPAPRPQRPERSSAARERPERARPRDGARSRDEERASRPRPRDGERRRDEERPSRAATPQRSESGRAQTNGRPHVSASRRRAEAERTDGPRKRIERAQTADRRGRTVAVERVTRTGPRAGEPDVSTRNARRFNAERQEREGGSRPPRKPNRAPERKGRPSPPTKRPPRGR